VTYTSVDYCNIVEVLKIFTNVEYADLLYIFCDGSATADIEELLTLFYA